jgi:hypothetical protein
MKNTIRTAQNYFKNYVAWRRNTIRNYIDLTLFEFLSESSSHTLLLEDGTRTESTSQVVASDKTDLAGMACALNLSHM